LPTGVQRLVHAGDSVEQDELLGDMAGELAAAFHAGKSRIVTSRDKEYFLNVFVPPPRLVLIGAVHISKALYPMAAACGYDVTIIDPRGAFATEERFPDVTLIADWPDDILPGLNIDRYTGVATLTHDPKIDDPALIHALGSEAFYIGALGSRKTHGRRVERLTTGGISENEIARIHAPIGLDIGAQSPVEIAVSILAEITAALHRAPAQQKVLV
ncbi:MAG: XdhC family protein, partial [Fimbriimonadaceae bacterium]|nr:XdhC family protein [Alphaproteobacteria bacterium]